MTFTSLSPNLMVEDVEASIAFYRDTLGLTVTATVPDAAPFVWASLKADGVEIMLQERHSLAEELPQFADRPLGGSLTLYIGVDDADALYSAIRGKATIIKAPTTTFYGAREFYAQDPSGYVLGFSSPAKSEDQGTEEGKSDATNQ